MVECEFTGVEQRPQEVFGGLTPVVVSLMLKTDKLAPAHYVVGVCIMGIVTALFVRKRQA